MTKHKLYDRVTLFDLRTGGYSPDTRMMWFRFLLDRDGFNSLEPIEHTLCASGILVSQDHRFLRRETPMAGLSFLAWLAQKNMSITPAPKSVMDE